MYRGWKLVVLLPSCCNGLTKHFLTVHPSLLITHSQICLGLFSFSRLVYLNFYLDFLNTQFLLV